MNTWERLEPQYFPSGGAMFTGTEGRAWRSAVPGGWFVLIEHSRADNPVGFFFPDPGHDWDGKFSEVPTPNSLLRPAEGPNSSSPGEMDQD